MEGTINIEQDNGVIDITLEKELSIYNVEELKLKLHDLCHDVSKITFSVKNIENLDLSGIQLLYSFRKSAIEEGVEFLFNIELNEEQNILVRRAGFEDILENN